MTHAGSLHDDLTEDMDSTDIHTFDTSYGTESVTTQEIYRQLMDAVADKHPAWTKASGR